MWWDWKRPIFYELFPKNKTINSDVYCEQLQKLSDAIAQKRPELINLKDVVFHHDNARPYTSLVSRQKLLQHSWDVLSHSSYSPCTIRLPSLSLLTKPKTSWIKSFVSEDLIKQHLNKFLAEKGSFTNVVLWSYPAEGHRTKRPIYH